MAELIILEYKESKGQFHYNSVNNGIPHDKPGTFGWEPIAFVEQQKASLFCDMIDCKLHRRKALNQAPYSTEYIRKEWKMFCYMFNYLAANVELSPEHKEFIKEHFYSSRALARLGNAHQADIKEAEELDWAWEYNPLDYVDSNF